MSLSAERVRQITISLPNRPGILADLCAHLGERGIDIRAITTLDGADVGRVRMVVDRHEDALWTLGEADIECTVSDCLAIEMPNHPSGFARIARILAVAGINIDFIYASSTADAARALGIFGVSDLDRALALDWESTPR